MNTKQSITLALSLAIAYFSGDYIRYEIIENNNQWAEIREQRAADCIKRVAELKPMSTLKQRITFCNVIENNKRIIETLNAEDID